MVMSISKNQIKKFIKSKFNMQITDDAADELAKFIEEKAEKISKYAIESAKKRNDTKINKEDILSYIKYLDDI